MAQTIQAYRRRNRFWKDWRNPFSWFLWFLRDSKPAVLFRYDTASGRETGAETFTRASTATYVTEAGVVATAASGIKRDRHYIGGQGPYLLLEGARTNLVVQSEKLNTTWTVTSCTVTEATDSCGVLSLCTVSSITDASLNRIAVTLTGDGVKAFSLFVKTNGVDGYGEATLFDATAPAVRCRLRYTITSGVVVGTCSTGTYLGTVPMGNGVYRLLAVSTSCTAANSHFAYSVSNSVGATLTSVRVSGVQVENAAFPSSYIPTTTAAVTRARDSDGFVPPGMLSAGATIVPCTFYLRYRDVGNAIQGSTTATTTAMVLSDATNSADHLRFAFPNGKASFVHDGGAAVSSTQTGALPTILDDIELLGVVFQDGSVQCTQVVNGGAEVAATASTGTTMGVLPAATVMHMDSSSGGGAGAVPWLAVKKAAIAIGIHTFGRMRSL